MYSLKKHRPKRLIRENPYTGRKVSFKMTLLTTTVALAAGTLLVVPGTMMYPKETKIEKTEPIIEAGVMLNDVYDMLEEFLIKGLSLKEEKALIDFYSAIYGLDSKKVYEIVSDLTNQFQDSAYVEQYIIGDSMVKGRYVECTSKEMAILIIVREIYYFPEDYQMTREEISTGVEYVSNLDYSHQIAYVSNVVGVDPALNYAICRAECSFNSPMFLNGHNPSGIMFDGEFASFPSFMAGFIEQALELLKYQIDGKTTPEEIGAQHAPTINGENEYWLPNVTLIYQEAIRDYERLFGRNEESIQKVLEY